MSRIVDATPEGTEVVIGAENVPDGISAKGLASALENLAKLLDG